MRIVHVIQPRSPHGTVLGASPPAQATGSVALSALREVIAADADDAGREHFILCAGGEAAQLAAQSAGLQRFIPLPCALGDVRRAAAELRRVMDALGRVEMAVAWGPFAGDVSRKLADKAPWWSVDVATGAISRRDQRGETTGDTWSLPWRASLARRGLSPHAARAALGLPSEQACLGLMADLHADTEATEFMLAISVLHAAGLRLSAVMPDAVSGAERARGHLHLGTYVREIAMTGMAPAGWASACDVCIIAEGGPFVSGLMLCDAIAAGCGVVLTRATQRVLGLEGVEDLAARSMRATDVARAALPLLDADAARADAVRRYKDAIVQARVPSLREGWFALARV